MLERNLSVIENTFIARDTLKMVIQKDVDLVIKAGQFINIKIGEYSLRRPISISNIENDSFSIIYKILGDGTRQLSKVAVGQKLNILLPLGNFFPIHDNLKEILIIGGGIGIFPLYQVAKEYIKKGTKVIACLGYNDKDSLYLEDDFKELGCEVHISTRDGSKGFFGNVVDMVLEKKFSCPVYSCGPKPMLDAVENNFSQGYISKEARMACGIGVCMACVCKDKKDKNKYYRICKEGPVFEIGRLE